MNESFNTTWGDSPRGWEEGKIANRKTGLAEQWVLEASEHDALLLLLLGTM